MDGAMDRSNCTKKRLQDLSTVFMTVQTMNRLVKHKSVCSGKNGNNTKPLKLNELI